MKHILTILTAFALCALPFSAQAQSEEDYLPKAGDFGFSVSANPISQIVKGTSATQPLVSIAGKYMLSNKTAMFLNVGWVYNYTNNKYYTVDDLALYNNPFSEDKVIDSRENHITGLNLSLGAEYRIGKGKVQGVFGGGIMYSFSYSDSRYSYGNAITAFNQEPSSYYYGTTGMWWDDQNNQYNYNYVKPGMYYTRTTRAFQGTPTHYVGLTGFAGVEWFVAPRLSVGARLNLTAAYYFTNGTYETVEGYNNLTGRVEEWTDLAYPSSCGVIFNSSNVGLDISFNVYF